MQMKPQELIKAIVSGVGQLVKAENETLKTVLLAEIKASEKRVMQRLTEKIERSTEKPVLMSDPLPYPSAAEPARNETLAFRL